MAPSRPLPRDLARALRALPLLVQRQVVLFPGVRVSLVVHEASELRLVREVAASHGIVGVACQAHRPLAPGPARDHVEVAGAGTIIDHGRVAGGRCGLVVLGRGRVRLQACRFDGPFARAQAALLPSQGTAVPAAELAALHAHARRFAALLRQRDPGFRFRLSRSADPGAVADGCAHALLLDSRQRQQVLELLDVRERVARVTALLAAQCCTLEHEPGARTEDLN